MSNDYKVTLDRCNYFEREWITSEMKRKAEAKTNGRCAMCGKKIKLGDPDFTVDHFIPIDLGGSNDIKNLIPLCYDCNQEKGNKILSARSIIKYMKPKYKEQLIALQDRYSREYNFMSKDNILCFDHDTYKMITFCCTNTRRRPIPVTINISIRKIEEVTDELMDLICTYNATCGLDSDRDSMRSTVEGFVQKKLIYGVYKESNNKLVACIYFYIQESNLGFEVVEDEIPLHPELDYETKYNIVEIGNIVVNPTLDKITLCAFKAALLQIIMEDMQVSFENLGLQYAIFSIQLNRYEETILEMLDYHIEKAFKKKAVYRLSSLYQFNKEESEIPDDKMSKSNIGVYQTECPLFSAHFMYDSSRTDDDAYEQFKREAYENEPYLTEITEGQEILKYSRRYTTKIFSTQRYLEDRDLLSSRLSNIIHKKRVHNTLDGGKN